jgi:REP element-mobilizing transposase RayT
MSPFDPKVHHRRSIRLKGYDYSQPGAYFVTTVAWGREMAFGEVSKGEMRLNHYGHIVRSAWFDLPHHYGNLELGAFVVMPNHVHGIIVLTDGQGRGGSAVPGQGVLPEGKGRGGSPVPGDGALPDQERAGRGHLPARETRPYVHPTRPDLSEIVRAFKSFSATRINRLRHTEGNPVWQRNYYEHVVRNQREMERIAAYIESNPMNWDEDEENPWRRGAG